MAQAKAKTIQIIFVKENNIGYLLEGEELQKYNVLHNQAIAIYKKHKGMIERISGKKVTCQIIEIEDNEQVQYSDIPTNRIVIIKNDGTALLLQSTAFKNYQEYHFDGLALLGRKQDMKGRLVKVAIT